MLANRTREPQQERSRAGVRRLLAAAEHILETDGFDGLTIARITGAAGVSVGSYYQFFEDKNAIVEVLAKRYITETASLIGNLVDAIVDLQPGTRLAAAFEGFVELYRSNPAYRVIRAASYSSPDLRRADDRNVAAAVAGVRRLLVTGTGVGDSDAVGSTARTLQLVVDSLLHRASEVRSKDLPSFIIEASAMLTLLEKDAIKRLARRGHG
jgi:AcrR family transcriptional regulator